LPKQALMMNSWLKKDSMSVFGHSNKLPMDGN